MIHLTCLAAHYNIMKTAEKMEVCDQAEESLCGIIFCPSFRLSLPPQCPVPAHHNASSRPSPPRLWDCRTHPLATTSSAASSRTAAGGKHRSDMTRTHISHTNFSLASHQQRLLRVGAGSFPLGADCLIRHSAVVLTTGHFWPVLVPNFGMGVLDLMNLVQRTGVGDLPTAASCGSPWLRSGSSKCPWTWSFSCQSPAICSVSSLFKKTEAWKYSRDPRWALT